MENFRSEFIRIAGAFTIALFGAGSILISAFRRRGAGRSLASFGALSLVYGTRWLVEMEIIRTALGFPFDQPYLHALLTYILPIPLAAFLTQTFGPGLWQSMRLVFWSSVLNAIVAVVIDLSTGATSADGSIFIPLVIAWCIVGIVNLAFPKRREAVDLIVVRTGLLVLFLTISHDNVMSLRLLPWSVNLSNGGFLALCVGLGFVAVRHFLSNERALLAIEQELAIARQIQQSNLPTTLTVPDGLSIGARYVPMTAVAGDFYDVHVDDRGGVGILIADVSGHGVGAALIGSMLKVAFDAQTAHVDDPGTVLTELNRILRGKVGDGFVTACAVYVDVKRRRLRYANAGHPVPLLKKKNGAVVELSEGGTILGPFADVRYTSHGTPFAEGDRLLLYTDGLVEARGRSGDELGSGRLRAILRQTDVTAGSDGASASIIDHLTTWTGRSSAAPPDDDLTLVVVDRV